MPPKLLLADDSVTVQRVIELTFADQDIDVLVAGTGAQAIGCIEAERPDIVLADIGMPEPDGYAVSAFVKGHPELSGIPVVLLSSALEPVDDERMRRAGCDGVLAKPFEPQAIVSMVRALLGSQKEISAEALPGAAAEVGTASPAPDAAAAHMDADPLEAYFDRLDAAFATYAATAADQSGEPVNDAAAQAALAPEGRARAAGLDDVPAGWEPDAHADAASRWQPSFANAFVAMFAPEADGGPRTPGISEEIIDEIARRVVAKLGDESMRRLMIDTAERIVREEIERIKQASRSGPTHSAG